MDTVAAAASDPRIERTRQVVLEAVLAVVAESGYGAVTIEAVAARSGVAKSTIYRHWPGRAELLNDAFRTLQPPVYECHGGDVRSRVVRLLEDLAERTAESTWSACLPSLVDAAARDPEARDALHSRLAGRRTLVDLLAEGVASGELPADLDTELMAEALAGPILLRRLFATAPLASDQVRRIVEQVLPVRPGAAPAPRPAGE